MGLRLPMRCPMSICRAVGKVKTRELAGPFPTRPRGFEPLTFGSVEARPGLLCDVVHARTRVYGALTCSHLDRDLTAELTAPSCGAVISNPDRLGSREARSLDSRAPVSDAS